jgi:hypothetical protein
VNVSCTQNAGYQVTAESTSALLQRALLRVISNKAVMRADCKALAITYAALCAAAQLTTAAVTILKPGTVVTHRQLHCGLQSNHAGFECEVLTECKQ